MAKKTERRIVEPEERHRDPPEDLPARRAVDMRGLVQAAVDLLEAGDVEHHVEAEILPDHDDQDGVHGDVGFGEDVGRRGAEQSPRASREGRTRRRRRSAR